MDFAGLSPLLLVIVANGGPVIGAALFRRSGAKPIDGGLRGPDKQPLLGQSKTWRGIILGLLAPAIMASLMGLPPQVGFTIGACAMAGDLLSSFLKRRLRLKPSSRALGLDQIPESLLPLLAVKGYFQLGWATILEAVVAFFLLELLLSQILYRLRVRRQPY